MHVSLIWFSVKYNNSQRFITYYFTHAHYFSIYIIQYYIIIIVFKNVLKVISVLYM